jgi:hypothetical protein
MRRGRGDREVSVVSTQLMPVTAAFAVVPPAGFEPAIFCVKGHADGNVLDQERCQRPANRTLFRDA